MSICWPASEARATGTEEYREWRLHGANGATLHVHKTTRAEPARNLKLCCFGPGTIAGEEDPLSANTPETSAPHGIDVERGGDNR